MNFLRFLQQRRALAGGVLALVYFMVLIPGWVFWPGAFFRGYWLALMFWTQLTVGAWVALLIQHLTGGEWGRIAAPYLRAAASSIFLLLPLFLPPLLALPHLFSWTQIRPGISAAALVNKEPWLNSSAFILRTVFYLAALAVMIGLRRRDILAALAGPLLVFTIVLFSFYSADWMMSLEPSFYSSMYPFLYFSGAMVAIFSLLSGAASWSQIRGLAPPNPGLLLDYGTLLFASVLFWGYIVFSQFIIIWTGNLPNESEWYLVRSGPSWLWLTLLVLACHFAIPFCLLLSRSLKKNPRQLLALAVPLLGLHLVEVFWMMRPAPGEGFRVSIFDFLMPVLFGVAWLWFILGARESSFSPSPAEAVHDT